MERESDEKHEYIFGKIIPMSGASTDHNRIAKNMVVLFENMLPDEYEVFIADHRVYNPVVQSYVYPDVVVVKGELEYADDMFDTLTNPLLVADIASDSNRLKKFSVYRKANSFKEYMLIVEDKVHIAKYYQTREGLWEIEDFTKLEESLYLKSVDVTLQVKDIYKKVKFK